jgi:hypothetical protein
MRKHLLRKVIAKVKEEKPLPRLKTIFRLNCSNFTVLKKKIASQALGHTDWLGIRQHVIFIIGEEINRLHKLQSLYMLSLDEEQALSNKILISENSSDDVSNG